MENENVLIEHVRQGDRASFDRLVALHRQQGLNVAYNLAGNLEDAKDVLQEAFFRAYLNIPSFHGDAKFSTWFYRIVVNCALNFLKRRKRSYYVFTNFPSEDGGAAKEIEIADDRYNPRKEAAANELSRNLDECIAGLSAKQRVSFILKHKNGLSIEEISQILKCSPSTVKVHLFRAVGNLRTCLSKYI